MNRWTDRPKMTAELREKLGMRVREVWVLWAIERSQEFEVKGSWLTPWGQLEEHEREVDRRIGEALFYEGTDGAIEVCDDRADAERVYTPGPSGEASAAPYDRAIEDIKAFRTDGKRRPIGGAYAGLTARKELACDFDHPHPSHPCGRHVPEASTPCTCDKEYPCPACLARANDVLDAQRARHVGDDPKPEYIVVPALENARQKILEKIIEAAREATCDTHNIPACVELGKTLYAYDKARGAICPVCDGAGSLPDGDSHPGEGPTCTGPCGGTGLVEPTATKSAP